MKLTSSAFSDNGIIPQKYTCDGEDINPPLTISDVPNNAKSLALIVDDPDAPAGTWVHWVVFNVNPKVREIKEKSSPEGATEGITSFGKPGYGGPCPPSGVHRYFFSLFVLDATLPLSASSTAKDVEQAMQHHLLTQARLMGRYQRK